MGAPHGMRFAALHRMRPPTTRGPRIESATVPLFPWALGVLLAPLLASCDRYRSSLDDAKSGALTFADVEGPMTVAPAQPPLAAEWLERIELSKGRILYVAPPVGSTEPRPIVVAVHGAVDDPGLICSAWRLVTDVYPFVVCPAGAPVGKSTYVWSTTAALDSAIDEALGAVRARFGDRISPGPAIYVAFSQGANMAGAVVGRTSGRFSRVVLTEGGYRAFDLSAAKRLASAGGERVLFTCSQPGCASSFEGSRQSLVAAKIQARVSYSGPHGHSMPPAVRESIHGSLPWLVEGLVGWEGYASATKLPSH